jgi:hypothetical protein
MWTPAERVADLVFTFDPATPDTIIHLDSTFIPPAAIFSFTVLSPDTQQPFSFVPQFVQGVIVVGSGSGADDLDRPKVPRRWALHQNVPNPFNSNTYIDFDLPISGEVKLEVFSILGRKVATLVDEFLKAGHKRVEWNGTDRDGNRAASGIYFYRLSVEDFSETRKMLLLE